MGTTQASAGSLRLVVPDPRPAPLQEQRTVLMVVQNPRLVRAVTRVMHASHVDLVSCNTLESAAGWLSRSPVDVVVLDYDLIRGSGELSADAVRESLGKEGAPPVILLSEKDVPLELAQFLETRFRGNVIAKLGEFDNSDLLVTARKLIQNDIFGIEKYLRWGSVIHSYPVHDSRRKSELLGLVDGFLVDLQCGRRQVSQMLTVVDEMVLNALYDAPVDAQGNRPYHRQSRTQPVELPVDRAAELTFGSDGQVFAVACRDPYGSLDPASVYTSLARCMRKGADQVREGEGGAGIGLYMIFQYCSHMIININPGKATEFVGIVDISRSAKTTPVSKSLNVFVQR